MTLYSQLGHRRAWQAAGDLLVAGWVLVWVWLGSAVHETVSSLAVVGEGLVDGGSALSGHLGDAADQAAGVPLVGEQLREPFDRAAGAAAGVAQAGRGQQEAVEQLALLLGLVTAVVPIAVVLLVWLPPRVLFVRRATAARRHLDRVDDLDLFALRAMTRQPMHRLARVSDDPVGDWRRGDPDVVRRLAELELAAMGLRPPRADA
jgi:hypothetical protein